jgi:hypothetical protein
MKNIKIFNGRVYKSGRFLHAYVGSHSQKHAIELVKQAGYGMTQSEINTYWSKGCWGKSMDGIEPQVGVWIREDTFDAKVERIV